MEADRLEESQEQSRKLESPLLTELRNHQELKVLYQRTKTQLDEILDQRRNLKDVLAVFSGDSDKVDASTQTVVEVSHLDEVSGLPSVERAAKKKEKRERQKAMKRAEQTRDDIPDPETEKISDTLTVAEKKSDNFQDDIVDAETEYNSDIPTVVHT